MRTYAGMLSRGSWLNLPTSPSSVLIDVDGLATDLGLFLASADLLVLRDGAALVLVLPPPPSTAGPVMGTGRRPCAGGIACRCPG